MKKLWCSFLLVLSISTLIALLFPVLSSLLRDRYAFSLMAFMPIDRSRSPSVPRLSIEQLNCRSSILGSIQAKQGRVCPRGCPEWHLDKT